MDAVNRAKHAPNHTDVLGVGQYWRFNASDFHGPSYHFIQPQEFCSWHGFFHEVLQAAIFEALIIGEIVNFQVGPAIAIGVLAIFLMLSFHKSDAGLSGLFSSLRSKQSLLGLQLAHFWGCPQCKLPGRN